MKLLANSLGYAYLINFTKHDIFVGMAYIIDSAPFTDLWYFRILL